MLPISLIHTLGLFRAGSEVAELGDGRKVTLDRFVCWFEWFGQTKRVSVLANHGKYSLLGVGLMAGHVLTVDIQGPLLS